jgi:hypothetical protein
MSYCSKCGAQIGEGDPFCGKCGAKVATPVISQPKEARVEAKKVGTSCLAIAALVLGILGLLLSPLSIPAIICGALGVGRTGEGKMGGHGIAVAGLVLGCISLAVWLIALIIMVVVLGWWAI